MICTRTKCDTVYLNCSTTKKFLQQNPSKLSTYDDFIAVCCDRNSLSENNKEKSKRVLINIEVRYFRTTFKNFNSEHKPPTTSAVNFRKAHHVQLPLLSLLGKVCLAVSGSGLLSKPVSLCANSGRVLRVQNS